MLVLTEDGIITLFRGFVKSYGKTVFLTAIGPRDRVFSIDEELYCKTGKLKNVEAVHV
jgi:hypothetical protein